MKQSKTTLADIAAKTGFGTNTVSLALRGSTRISQKTREAVVAVAQDLDYVPNNSAKSLVLSRSHTIGLLVPEITNPVMNEVARAIQLELARRGYGVLFATSDGNIETERKAIEMCRSHMVDGLLIYPMIHADLDHLASLRNRGFPIVLLIGSTDTRLDSVGIDELAGAQEATTHLIDLGHTKIGAVMGKQNIEAKVEGFHAALAAHGLTCPPSWSCPPKTNSNRGGYEAMGRIMTCTDRPTAVFVASDILALGALRWARENGLDVPEDVSIIGFDDIEYAGFAWIALSTIRNDVTHMGQKAVDRLMTLIDADGALPEPVCNPIVGDLVPRESTGPLGRG